MNEPVIMPQVEPQIQPQVQPPVEPQIQPPVEPVVEPKKEKSDNTWKILTGLFALIAIILGVLYLTKKDAMTVVFINEDSVRLEKVSKGNKVNKLQVEDEDFLGWYDGENEFDFNKGVEKDYVLFAKFDTSTQFTVTFDTVGGSTIDPVKVKENRTLTMPASPTKSGMLFNEWTLDGKVFDFSTPITSDITLKATWRENDNTVMVRFDSAGGSNVASQKVPVGEAAKKPNNPTRYGYNFVEWQLDGKAYDFSQIVNNELTLKATWKEKQKVTLSFNSDGGSSVASKQVYVGEAVGNLPSPTKSGYVFRNWTLNGSTFNANSKVNGNTTVKARWSTVDEYNLEKAIATIKGKSYVITKDGQDFPVTSNGCTIKNRPTSMSVKSVTFDVTCGSKTDVVTVNATVKAPTFACTYKPDPNMINYNVTIKGVSNGMLYRTNGSPLAEIAGGVAQVNNGDITGNTTKFKMQYNGSTYDITCTKAG